MGTYAAQSTREFFAEAFTISQYLPNYQKPFMSLFREALYKVIRVFNILGLKSLTAFKTVTSVISVTSFKLVTSLY